MTILRPSQDIITGGWQGSPPGIVTSKQVWRQQPQVPVGIDWSNPLTRGLVWVPIPNDWTFNLAKNDRYLTNSGVTYAPNKRGIEANFANTGYLRNSTRSLITTVPFTYAVIATPASTLLSDTLFTLNVNEGYAYTYSLYFVSGTKALVAQTYDGSDSSAQSSYFPAAGVTTNCAGIWESDSKRSVYHNGIVTTNTDTQSAASSINSFVVGWSPWDAASKFPGTMIAPALWNRALSKSELDSYFANPWQIFTPIKRTTYFLPPLYDQLDETTASDADYIATSTAGDIARVSLGTYTTSGGTHSLKYRAASPEADRGLIARVLELGQPPAIILKRDVWKSQPQVPVGIKKYGAHVVESVSRRLVTSNYAAPISNTFIRGVGNHGVSFYNQYLGNSGASYSIPSVTIGTGDFTIAMSITKTQHSTEVYQYVFGTSVSYFSVALKHDSIGGNIGLAMGSGPTFVNTGIAAPNTGDVNFVIRRKSGVIYWNINNKTGSVGNTISIGAISSFGVNGLHGAGGAYCVVAAAHYYVTAFDPKNAWTETEASDFVNNPYSIFKPKSTPLFIDAPKVIASQTKTSAELSSTALVLKRDVWRSQPENAPLIDKRLQVINQYGLVHGTSTKGTTGLFQSGVGRFGKCQLQPGGVSTNYNVYPIKPVSIGTGDFTYFIVFEPLADESATQYIYAIGSNTTFGLSLKHTSSGNGLGIYISGAIVNPSIPHLAYPGIHKVVVTRRSGVIYVNANGKTGSVANTSSVSDITSFVLGSYTTTGGFGLFFGCKYYLSGIQVGAWTDSYANDFVNNPWQIFRKQPKPLYFDLGPNEHNLTLSSEETSSITDNSELALEVEST